MNDNLDHHIQNIINHIEETTGNPVTVTIIGQMIFVSIKNRIGVSNAKVGDKIEAIAFLNGYLMGWMSKTEQDGGDVIPYHCISPNHTTEDDGEDDEDGDEEEDEDVDAIYNALGDAINRIISQYEEDEDE